MILHLHSNFALISEYGADAADTNERFSIWRPSAILNLQNFNFVSKVHSQNGNLHLRTKFDRNLIIHS